MNTSIQGAGTPKGAEPARRKRVLFVSAGLSPRGGGIAAAGRLLLAATRRWAADRGADVRLLTLGGADEVPAGMDGEAFDGDRLRMARAVWRSQMLEGYRHHVYDFLGVARYQGVLPARMRARYLVYLYGIECWRPLRGSRARALAGAAVRLACSAATIERFRAHNPQAPMVAPLHLALPERETGEVTTQNGYRGDGDVAPAAIRPPFLLIVGRLAPGERYKGHDEMLAALARLSAAHPDLSLVVAGEGEDRPRLEARARELGVVDRVHFLGYVDDATLDELYARCTALAMPSSGEGFGFVYLEAMRAGKPCIALAGTAAAEIVADGETGVLVDGDVPSLVTGIESLLADPARAQRLGAAGRERWRREFTFDRFARDVAREIDTLVA